MEAQQQQSSDTHHTDDACRNRSRKITASAGDPGAEKPVTTPKWPCANCHALVHEKRCPACFGIQVKIQEDWSTSHLNRWLERVGSPFTHLPRTSPFARDAKVGLDKADAVAGQEDVPPGRVRVDEVDDDNEEDDVDNDLLELGTPEHLVDEEEDGRPGNPVASLLARTPSPTKPSQQGAENLKRKHDDSIENEDKLARSNGVGASKKQKTEPAPEEEQL